MSTVLKKNRLLLLLLSTILGLCMVWAFSAQMTYAADKDVAGVSAQDEYGDDDWDYEPYFNQGGVDYYLWKNGTEAYACKESNNVGPSVTILDKVTIDGKVVPVTYIDGFYNCKNLKFVTIPGSVVDIGDWAFENTGIMELTVPASVKSIGKYAFGFVDPNEDGKDTLIPGFVVKAPVGSYAYNWSKLHGIAVFDPSINSVFVNSSVVNAAVINGAITAAGGRYDYITSVTLGKNVKKIAANTFQQYGNVKTVTVQTKKLSKKKVKNSLKGSAVTKVKVQIGKKKVNKKYVKKYKKIFTKKNAGKKVKVGL